MKLAIPQLIIYDLDGTLIDSVPDIAGGLNRALKEVSLPPVEIRQVGLWIGNGSLKLVERALTHIKANLSELHTLHTRFLFHYGEQVEQGRQVNGQHTSKTFEGTHALMALFKQHGIPQAIATNKPQQFVPGILKTEGLSQYVDAIVGGNTLPECKPSPLPLLTLCDRFYCPPSHAIMIGDSTADAKSALNANIPCWLLEQGYAQGADLHQLGAQAVFQNTQQLLKHARTLFS